MSAPPKLPIAARQEILKTVERRRQLMKQIATLQDEKRKLPNNKSLAEMLGCSYRVIRRALYGDPYKNQHPDDDQARTARPWVPASRCHSIDSEPGAIQMSAVITTQKRRSAYDKLPRRLKRFVDQYVIGGTAESAMRASGYKGLYPNQVAHKWLKKHPIKEAVEEATERYVADVGVRQVTVLKQMAAVATLDPRKLVDANGKPIPLHLLDEATAAAISLRETHLRQAEAARAEARRRGLIP